MTNTKATPGTSALENLRYIAAGSITRPQLSRCMALARTVCDELGIADELNEQQCEWLETESLETVITHMRGRAINAGAPSITRGAVINAASGRSDPGPFRAAAAGELLGFHEESAFHAVRGVLGIDERIWDILCAKEKIRTEDGKRLRQLRARLWLGEREGKDYSSKAVRGREKEDELLHAVEAAISAYLEDEKHESKRQAFILGVKTRAGNPRAKTSTHSGDMNHPAQPRPNRHSLCPHLPHLGPLRAGQNIRLVIPKHQPATFAGKTTTVSSIS